MRRIFQKDIEMTSGPLFRKIVTFSLPIVLTYLLQMLFNSADMMIVSLSAEENAVGALGAVDPVLATLLALIYGVSGGVTVVVSRRLGSGDREATSCAVHTAVAMSLPFGLATMLTILFLTEPVLRLLGVTGDLLRLAVLYARIFAVGIPFSSLFNFVFGVFNAKGDSRTPFFVMTFSGALNVALNFFFVLALGMSADGVAIATVISVAVSAVVLLYCLKKDEGPCRFSFGKLAIHKKAVGEILYHGVPNALQSALFGLSNMMITSSVMQVNNAVMATLPESNTYQPVINGNVAAMNVEWFASTAVYAVAQAALPFAGQNAGAREYRRVRRVFFESLLFAGALGSVVGWALILLRAPILSLYGIRYIADTPQAIAFKTAELRLMTIVSVYALYALMQVSAEVLRGIGKAITGTALSLVGVCAFQIVWIFTVFHHYGSLFSIYISYPIAWTLTGAILCAITLLTIRKRAKQE